MFLRGSRGKGRKGRQSAGRSRLSIIGVFIVHGKVGFARSLNAEGTFLRLFWKCTSASYPRIDSIVATQHVSGDDIKFVGDEIGLDQVYIPLEGAPRSCLPFHLPGIQDPM